MRLLRSSLLALAPSLPYLLITQLSYLAWADGVAGSIGLTALVGGTVLGVATMPAWSLGAPAFRELFRDHFASGRSDVEDRVLLDAQADIWLVTLWIYAAALVLCYVSLRVLAATAKRRRTNTT